LINAKTRSAGHRCQRQERQDRRRLVERRFTHPVLKKTVRRTKKYHAHDENNQFKTGDTVQIEECRPISKSRRWMFTRSDDEFSARADQAPRGDPRTD
jgi:small subunit ribosomal protein S17